MTTDLGLIGLGTMGSALARNIASRGYSLSLWNRTYEKITEFVNEFGDQSFYAPSNLEDFVLSIKKPRKIILMVPAGEATKAVLNQILPVLDPDDTVMDGGNSYFKETEEILHELEDKGIHFLGTGISGGEQGALTGPSIMPGGSIEGWEIMEDVLNAAAAEDFNGKACVAYMGKGGAGHYVKMVHNGIEYAEMQMLAEAYDLLRSIFKLKNDEIAEIFASWNEGRLKSFLTEIAVEVLGKKEDKLSLLDLILDKAAQKGTGRWTSLEAIELGVPTPSIAGAVFMRGISMDKELRSKLSKKYPVSEKAPNLLTSEFVDILEKALFLSRISNFEQGFALLRAANQEYGFELNFPEIVRIWQGGCIIRCAILKDIHEYFLTNVESLYFAEFVQKNLLDDAIAWRRLIALAAEHSVPLSVLSNSLCHFEAYRHERLSANFIQGLRDRFGSHTYERIDKEGNFHTDW